MEMYMSSFENAKSFLDSEFSKYDMEHNINCNSNRFSIMAYDNTNLIGAITFNIFYGEAYIDDIAVKKEYRNSGVGTKLINTVEMFCKDRKVSHITLNTYEFQAPKFYEKLGYKIELIRTNSNNSKLDRYYFIKYLN